MNTAGSRIAAIITFLILVMFQSFQVKWGVRDKIDVTFPTRPPVTESTGNTYDYDYITRPTRTTVTVSSSASTTEPEAPGSDEPLWGVTFGGVGSDVVNGSCACADGGVIICGNTNSASVIPGADKLSGWSVPYAFLAKYDSNGGLLWAASIGGNGLTCAYDAAELSDGSVVVVGYTMATNIIDPAAVPASVIDSFVFRYSASGSLISKKVLSGSGYDYFNCVAALPGGGFVAGGNSTSSDGDYAFMPSASGATLMAYASNGALSWTSCLTGTTGGRFYDVCVDADSSIFAACVSNSKDGSFAAFDGFGRGSNDSLVCKYSQTGALEWGCVIAGTGDERFENIAPDGNGGCVAAGYFTTLHDLGAMDGTLDGYSNCGETDGMVFFIDSNGEITSGRVYGGYYDDYITDLVKVGDCYAISGYTKSNNRTFLPIGNLGGYDAFMLVVDGDGDILDLHSMAGSDRDLAYTVCATADGAIVVSGTASSTDEFFSMTAPPVELPQSGFVVKYELP